MWAIKSVALLIGVSTFLAGCVYPAKRTYYEITSTDGDRTPSSCTYPSGRKDAIRRELSDVHLYVTSYSHEPGYIDLAVQFSTKQGEVAVAGDKILIQANQKQISPVKVELSSYNSGNANDPRPFKYWVNVKYPIEFNELSRFSLIFDAASVKYAGRSVPIEPVSFSKVSKVGIYLFTINC